MRRLVVIGGGVAGLSAAWTARREGAAVAGGLDVELFEREAEVGGKARTVVRNGWLVEEGPSGFLGGREGLERLARECGAEEELVPSNRDAARRFLHLDGRMREIVPSPLGFARSGILSPFGLARLAVEPFVPRRRNEGDESVWAFAARRIGREAADRLILPMALGIFAGDAHRLSLPAAFPRMAALEREHGSLIRGMIARRGKSRSGRLTSFREGMQSFPAALAARGEFGVQTRTAVRSIARDGAKWKVRTNGSAEPVTADAVVFACEPYAAAELLRAHDADAAADLESISCPPVAVVALGFWRRDAVAVPPGFGVLIPRGEGYRMLGNLWDSAIFPGRSPRDRVLIRAMYGGAVDPETAGLPEDELLILAREEMSRLYRLTAPPVFEHVAQWPRAIPQYEMGHLERVARIERRIAALPGFFLCGNGLYGVAFADAAESGIRAGERAARWLAATPLP